MEAVSRAELEGAGARQAVEAALAARGRGTELRTDAAGRLEAARATMAGTLGGVVDEARAGLRLLGQVEEEVEELQTCFHDIDALCTECADVIDHQDLISHFSRATFNLGAVIRDAERILSIPTMAQDAQELMSDPDVDLVDGYQCISELEAASEFARVALSSAGKNQIRKFEYTFMPYFEQVVETSRKFEELLWERVRAFVERGKAYPHHLVAAAKVVELQEKRDRNLAKLGHLERCKNWREKVFEEIFRSITRGFDVVYDMLRIENVTDEKLPTLVSDALDHANYLLSDLTDIYDFSAPCFPTHYNSFARVQAHYHGGYGLMLDLMGGVQDDFSNKDILLVMAWVREYKELMLNLGVEEEGFLFVDHGASGRGLADLAADGNGAEVSLDAFLKPKGGAGAGPRADGVADEARRPGQAGLTAMMNLYVVRVMDQLNHWYKNIIESDLQSEPKQDTDGRLWKPGTIDLFRILHEQVDLIAGFTTGEMLYDVGQAVIKIMNDYQGDQTTILSAIQTDAASETGLENIVTVINSNSKAYSLSLELVETIEETLDAPFRGKIDIEETCRGFLFIAKTAVESASASVLADPGLQDVLKVLFGYEWLQGKVTSVLLATLKDYMGDLKLWTEPGFFKRIVEGILEHAGQAWMEAIKSSTPVIQPDVIERMEEDCTAFRKVFGLYLSDAKLDKSKAIQMMDGVLEMSKADDKDDFVIGYRLILEIDVCSPVLVEKLVSAREDISRKDASDIMVQCREIFQEVQKDGTDRAAARGASGKAHAGAAAGNPPPAVKSGWWG